MSILLEKTLWFYRSNYFQQIILKRQEVLPCLNSDNLNSELEVFQTLPDWEGPKNPLNNYRDLIQQETIKKEINSIACLNYGFGGTNSAMIVSKDN